MAAPALADQVANRRETAGDATCITEMSIMMACWKQNDFNDTACAKEIQMFYDCVARAEVIKANLVFFRASGRKGREVIFVYQQ
ncbi:Coiled-coil-helix-coiled-coil-helix domain-containing protein 1 [Anas platyrhynchos]|uniref:Coiled-coil-helix-coiled-coil-helix domain-containing protein 1 n=1 Tax=Anas platyrhynchos TaxID=8839 RepID=R0LQU3_ANAPL|nr:Coiled-coil-helix-coiled-coil-helix domain-containing protein 1 [Anas platyrhynchos]